MKRLILSLTLGCGVWGAFAQDQQLSGDHPLVLQFKATLSATELGTTKTLRRWYVGRLLLTGNHPTVANISQLTDKSQGLFPTYGFEPPENVDWTIQTTADPRIYKVCYKVQAADLLEFRGLLSAIDASTLKRSAGPNCNKEPDNVLPKKFPHDVMSFNYVDIRDTSFPTVIPRYPVLEGLVPKKATAGLTMAAPPNEWGAPAVFTVIAPSLDGLMLTGVAPGSNFTSFGTTVPNYAEAIHLIASSTLSPERFKVSHTCGTLVAGGMCSISVTYKGQAAGAEPQSDLLRLTFANGATALIGLKGNTITGAPTEPLPVEEPAADTNEKTPVIPVAPPVVEAPSIPAPTPVPAGNLPVLGASSDWTVAPLSASPGNSDGATYVFRNNTGRVIKLNHIPTSLSWPFQVVPQSDCPSNGEWMQPNATCTLKVSFHPPTHALPNTQFSDTVNLRIHWQYRDCIVGACSDPSPSGSWAGVVVLIGDVLPPPLGSTARLTVVEGNSLSLGTLAKGKTYTYTVTLENTGGNPLALYNFNSNGPGSWVDPQGSISTINMNGCSRIEARARCTVKFTVTPGSWMQSGQTRGVIYKANGQDAASYQPLPESLLYINYTVGN